MAHPVRRNIAHLTAAERQAYIEAMLQADLHTFADGVSYWDKQDQIHQCTHNHGGNSFIPWHRELVNRYEALLQQSNPDVALHYWDWTEDPRAAVRRAGRHRRPVPTTTCSGTVNGTIERCAWPAAQRRRRWPAAGRTPATPPTRRSRSTARRAGGHPGLASDTAIIAAERRHCPRPSSGHAFRQALESGPRLGPRLLRRRHRRPAPGVRGSVRVPAAQQRGPAVRHVADPARRRSGGWTPTRSTATSPTPPDDGGILHDLQPWDGTVEFGVTDRALGRRPHRRSRSRTAGTLRRPPAAATTRCR